MSNNCNEATAQTQHVKISFSAKQVWENKVEETHTFLCAHINVLRRYKCLPSNGYKGLHIGEIQWRVQLNSFNRSYHKASIAEGYDSIHLSLYNASITEKMLQIFKLCCATLSPKSPLRIHKHQRHSKMVWTLSTSFTNNIWKRMALASANSHLSGQLLCKQSHMTVK
jgi:hypothetical protein